MTDILHESLKIGVVSAALAHDESTYIYLYLDQSQYTYATRVSLVLGVSMIKLEVKKKVPQEVQSFSIPAVQTCKKRGKFFQQF